MQKPLQSRRARGRMRYQYRSPATRLIGRPWQHAHSALPAVPPAACHRWLVPVMEMAAVASGKLAASPEPVPLGWTWFLTVATRTPRVDAESVRAAGFHHSHL